MPGLPTPTYRALLDHLIHILAHQKTTEKMLKKLGVSSEDFKASYDQERQTLAYILDRRYSPEVGLPDRELSVLLRQLQGK